MEKKTIGSFIAALRKSKGMTQQEVAERLNVSNKTVSKWECDDGYPEIMLIPAIAELFGVTTDEILKGERIIRDDDTGRKDQKVKNQIKYLANKTISKFKNLSYIAIAFIILGFILLFSISYSFYKPTIGFGIMMIFVIAGIIIELVAVNNAHSVYKDNEVFEEQDNLNTNYIQTLFSYGSFCFCTGAIVIISGLPFILVRSSSFIESVINFQAYLSLLPLLIFASVLVCTIGKSIAYNKIARSYSFDTKIKKINTASKKFAVAFIIIYIITGLANFFVPRVLPRTVETTFETQEEFNSFIEDMEKYEADKEAAIKSDAFMMREEHIKLDEAIFSDTNHFILRSVYEEVKDIDNANLTIISNMDFKEYEHRVNILNKIFLTLYYLEAIAIGLIYLAYRKRVISK